MSVCPESYIVLLHRPLVECSKGSHGLHIGSDVQECNPPACLWVLLPQVCLTGPVVVLVWL